MKKILSVLLCFCLIFNMTLTSMAYTGADAMNLLKAMDIIHGDHEGNLRPDDAVRRSEFAKMAVLLSEYKDSVALNSKISVFTDCSASHWAAPYVKVAAEQGIIRGYSDGRFGPDDNITYAQAVTVALRLLGYTDEDFGFSYPEGQLGMAASLKLNSGITKSRDEILSRSEVSVILSNMLSTSKKDASTDYIESLGYSVQEEIIIVASNDEDASVTPGKVYTSNGEYEISDYFDKSLIGSKGKALVDSEGRLISVLENSITSQKYAVYTAGSELVTVYGPGGSITLNCDDGTLCYDGIKKTTFASVRAGLSTGDVLSIGKDKDGNIDYIIVGESDFEGPFTVRADGIIPKDDGFENYAVVKNGNKASLSDIKKHDIVYISASLGTVFSYSKKISGIYSKALPNIDSPQSVVVGGKEYAIESPLAFSKLSSGGSYSIGDTVVLLIGRDGGIADIMDENHEQMLAYTETLQTEGETKASELALMSEIGAVSLDGASLTGGNVLLQRGEFAKMAVMSSLYRNTVAQGSKVSVFPDCPSSYWATPYIKVAVQKGMMSAYSDAKFHPEESVTLAQALDASLKILGYQDTDFSDWPSSQLSIAESKGISDGIYKSANDPITKSEAVTILYNTLCATNKQGVMKGIEAIGYEYYEDAVLIATNKENSSVSSGKILTSVGTFSVDNEVYNSDDLGKSVELLIYSGKIQHINKKPYYYSDNIIYSSIPGGLAMANGGSVSNLSVPDSTAVYMDTELTNFAAVKSEIAVGDSACMCYDEAKRLKYIYLSTSNLAGPYVVKSPLAWYSQISGADSSSTVMKNGSEISASELLVNDILYYSSSLDTAFAYNDKVIGILENASPTKDAPDTVTVSGVNYTLESADVSLADVNYGDTLVLCLGRNGKVANSYPASGTELAGYLIATGTKEFTNHNGEKYTSMYASLVLPDGTQVDCATDSDYDSWINKVMLMSINGSKAKLTPITSNSDISGVISMSELKFGNSNLSKDVKILDVGYTQVNEPTVYTPVYLQRIDGVSVAKTDILYTKTENGVITELILNDVTGDAFEYGVITSANANVKGMSASGSYTCNIGGSSYSYSGGAYTNLSKGSFVKVSMSGGRIGGFTKINPQSVDVDEVSYTAITLDNGNVLRLSDDVTVYKTTSAYSYTIIPLSDLIDNPDSYKNYTVFSDKPESQGGRVRIILVR